MALANVSDRRAAFLDFHGGEQADEQSMKEQAEKGGNGKEMVVIHDRRITVKELLRCIVTAYENLENRGQQPTREAILDETLRIIDATEAATRKLLEACFQHSAAPALA